MKNERTMKPPDDAAEPKKAALSSQDLATEYLANERTDGMGTGIAVITLGFGLAKARVWLGEFLPHRSPNGGKEFLPHRHRNAFIRRFARRAGGVALFSRQPANPARRGDGRPLDDCFGDNRGRYFKLSDDALFASRRAGNVTETKMDVPTRRHFRQNCRNADIKRCFFLPDL
jgi:hypothetical protein